MSNRLGIRSRFGQPVCGIAAPTAGTCASLAAQRALRIWTRIWFEGYRMMSRTSLYK